MNNSYICEAKVLSPIHIGSGNKYGRSEYLPIKRQSNGKKIRIIKRINISEYYLSLSDDKKDDFISKLADPEFGLTSLNENISKDFLKYQVKNKCSSNPKYNQEIEETIKTFNKVYVPGSSIKGAIKTAIAYNLLDYDDISKISKFINIRRFWDFNREYVDFIDGFFISDIEKPSAHAQKNIMRFLQISDSDPAKLISVYDIYTLMAAEYNNRKTTVTYKRYNKKIRDKVDVISFYETIDIGNTIKFTINNNFNGNMHSSLHLNDKLDLIGLENIKNSIFVFSEDYINNELDFCEKYSIDYLYKFYNNLSKKNSVDKPLLKIGAGSGFLATTFGLKIKEYNPRLYDDIIERKKGYNFCFPKSRKLTKKTNKPLGWMQLSFQEK